MLALRMHANAAVIFMKSEASADSPSFFYRKTVTQPSPLCEPKFATTQVQSGSIHDHVRGSDSARWEKKLSIVNLAVLGRSHKEHHAHVLSIIGGGTTHRGKEIGGLGCESDKRGLIVRPPDPTVHPAEFDPVATRKCFAGFRLKVPTKR
jgi:hypothetical protein